MPGALAMPGARGKSGDLARLNPLCHGEVQLEEKTQA